MVEGGEKIDKLWYTGKRRDLESEFWRSVDFIIY